MTLYKFHEHNIILLLMHLYPRQCAHHLEFITHLLSSKSLRTAIAAMKLKNACPLKGEI